MTETQTDDAYYVLITDGNMDNSGTRTKGEDPGHATIGAVLKRYEKGKNRLVDVDNVKHAIGPASIDGAEYQALIEGLNLASRYGVQHIRVFLDRETVVDRMNRIPEVVPQDLKARHDEARSLADKFKSFRISWVPRPWTGEADELARQALDD